MIQQLDPIDQFEISLQRTPRAEPLLSLGIAEALEFAALRFQRWRTSREDLLDSYPELLSWPALRALRGHANHCQLFEPERGRRPPSYAKEDTRVGVQQFGTSDRDWAPTGVFAHFQEQFRQALRQRGIQVAFAGALAAALKEMASNAVEHANAPVLPIVCFEVGSRYWSFGVVDVGRGVLASLSSNQDYEHLKNETEALTLALQPGVSRVRNQGRGTGFSTVFKALVDRQVSLRFRSGGVSAQWAGVSPTHQSLFIQALPLSSSGFRVRVTGLMEGVQQQA